MRLEIKKYLFDIIKSCDLLVEFTRDKTFLDYESDPMLRSAVERQFEIIGEALNKILRDYPDTAQGITDYKRIIAFRNILIHGYADISNEVVWGVLETNLPKLIVEINELLND